ncbi:type I-E CRISPR-associated protein Cse1/CasA, partial [Roseomonas sp. SXEYE001]|uniref:type I-E CRISPR-associated protein Cse1/CasA n=1 Tax=Roseomonas xinghualingensis TaxID=2986475 RepID=UPI0021F0F41C
MEASATSPDAGDPAPLNLLRDSWLPVLRRSGTRDTIRPAQVTPTNDPDPVVALDWPRADFRFACYEFLIGLLSTAFPPEGSMAWRDLWEEPPAPEVLDEAFAPIAHAFALDGDGPRFLQDLEDLASEPEPIERLLIESPGASTLRNNTDLLVRRNRLASLGRPAAAMALYAFQSWAPAGGAGNRTGLRGGGPLCTLVAPPEGGTLWRLLWANVLPGLPPDPDDLPKILPWLAPTVTSEGARVVTPGVRRRMLWDSEEADLAEAPAHLVMDVRRLDAGAASVVVGGSGA